jgi:hypothetical protein
MADPLKLLFELDADGRPAVAEFKRVSTAFATELNSLKKLAASAAKLSLVESRTRPNDGAAAAKSTIDSQREVNRQIEAMWAAREKEQSASLKKQADIERAFATQQVSTSRQAANEIVQAYKDRESQLVKTAKQSEDAWAKHEAAKLAATKQAEKESESVVAAANAAKDKAAKTTADNFLKFQKQTAAAVVKANAQTAASEIRAALIAAKGTADISSVASKGIDSLSDHLNLFVSHRIPLAGGAFLRLTENVRGFITLSREAEGSVLRLGNIIATLSTKTGKSAPEIKDFLNSFAKLGTQIEKDEAAVNAFGPALAQKLIPQLAAADAEMTALAASTGEAGGAFASLAGPVGIAVLAVAAIVAAVVLAEKKMFDLAVASAKVEGKFVDLSQQIGLSAELLSAFDVLAATTDTNLGSLSASFGIFQKHLEEAQDPLSASAGLLGELGIQTTDTEAALRQTFVTLAKLPEGFRQTALALQLFGRGGKSVLAIIKETNGDLDTAIKRFRELGLIVSQEDARAADKFNDELELLNRQFQDLTVELGKEFLPAALEIVRTLSDLTKASKGLFDLIGLVGRPAIDTFADGLRGLSLVIASITRDLPQVARILKEIEDRQNIAPLQIPDIQPTKLPGQPSPLQKAREEARLVRVEVGEAVRFAETQIAAIDRQLQERSVSPAEALEPVIALERQKIEAVIKGLEAQREARAKEFIKDEADRQKMADDIQAIDEQIATQRANLDRIEADKRAAFRAQELQREQEHRRALADLFVSALNDRIAAVSRAAQAGTNSELFAQDVITELLKAGFAKRKQVLERERTEAGKDPALVKQVNAQLADLQRERTATLSEQANRRIEILRDENNKALELQRSSIDSLLRAGEIVDSSRIATIKSLAALRVKTEEQAAREILKIRLDALDREKSVALAEREVIDQQIAARVNAFSTQRRRLEAELSKTGSIADPTARVKEQRRIRAELQANVDAELDAQKKANQDRTNADTDLNNTLRVLGAERSRIQADGNRDIDTGREDDLSSARRYASELREIAERTIEIQRDAAEEAIRLLLLGAPDRKAIIKAQRDLELQREDDRHRRVTDSINAQQGEVDEQIRILESHLKSLKIGTTEEIEQYERLIAELEKLRLKRDQLNTQQDAENSRNQTRQRRTQKESDIALELEDPTSNRSLFGDTFTETVNETGSNLAGFAAMAGDILGDLSEQAGNFGTILTSVFSQLGDAVGTVVENFVKFGTAGVSFKKFAVDVIASVAKMAIVKSIFELAEAAAMYALFWFTGNPKFAKSGSEHLLAAAAYAAVGGVAAGVGRAVAGNSQRNAGTASAAVNGGTDAEPRNRTFNSGQAPVESSSQAAREGSGGFFGQVLDQIRAVQQQSLDMQRQQQLHNAQVAEALTRMRSARPGDVVTMGAPDAQQAIGVAVIDHSNSSGDFNEAMQRNLGFAR